MVAPRVQKVGHQEVDIERVMYMSISGFECFPLSRQEGNFGHELGITWLHTVSYEKWG